ncbi:serine hydrolase [Erythrobacter sp. QSSC1-22B]|uniref:serine hydrolase n=1 Tax=Erythrobacter sp. QSSC1-22B TaxID=1860125 RepID=UPI001F3E21AD|nr:serine hydrolase [Erythrobacter sp. QSSC1-22B]
MAAPALAESDLPALAESDLSPLEATFDATLGTQVRPLPTYQAIYETGFERRIAELADGSSGRIGVAAIDLTTGQEIAVLGDQRFPLASTSKIAIAATFLEGVEQGRWSLRSEFPLLWARKSARFSSPVAPVAEGERMRASELIEIMITRSSNPATDALLRAVGGPNAVNSWMRRNGMSEFNIDRDIATLVRDDGEFDPAHHIDRRDSATPGEMLELLTGLYQGKFLSSESRRVILGAMSRTRTGTRRIPAMMPASVRVSHKTGSLNNTSSDVGFLEMPDGRTVALAIYVTGQGSRPAREAKIAAIARAIHDGYDARAQVWTNARYGGQ